MTTPVNVATRPSRRSSINSARAKRPSEGILNDTGVAAAVSNWR